MVCRVHGAAHGRDVARDTRGRLVVNDEQPLDLVLFVLGQDLADAIRGRPLAPLHVDDVHPQSVPLGELDPEVTELPVARCQEAIARRHRVDQRRFPPSGTGRREDERLSRRRLEDLPDVAEQSGGEVGERGRAVILHGAIHRAEDALGHVGRAGDEQEGAAGHTLGPRKRRGKTQRDSALSYSAAFASPTPRMGGGTPCLS